jgi:hypothetical protein
MATLCLLFMIGPLINSGHELVYHLRGSASSVFVPVLFNLCSLCISFTVLLQFAENFRRVGFFRLAGHPSHSSMGILEELCVLNKSGNASLA